ncbi:GntR family transcriptional regulator [Streptomyces sp. NPDC091272]|uniref:GntR family transcriptional regulator n=1 Tax=Streptomyces sp. NPDC091272 TaxID=3365981 RepID=UPI00380C7AC1
MTLPLNEDPRPPYVQAAEVLRTAIACGELRAGMKLPSARELQRRFGISSSTVQNALRLLKSEGLIYSVLGRGSYVRAPKPGAVQVPATSAGNPDEGDVGDSGLETEEGEPNADVIHDERDPQYVGLGDTRRGWQTAPSEEHTRPYVRTAEALRELIYTELKPGDKLPSARELQEQFGIANSTVQNALRLLKDENLIYSVQGRGVFVSAKADGRERFLRRYHQGLRDDAEQRRAEEDAVKFSGETDEEVNAKAEQAAVRVQQARTELEAAQAELRALQEDQARRRRVNGEPDPDEQADQLNLLMDRLKNTGRYRP